MKNHVILESRIGICVSGGVVTFPLYLCGRVLHGTSRLSGVGILLYAGTGGPLFQKPRMTPVWKSEGRAYTNENLNLMWFD